MSEPGQSCSERTRRRVVALAALMGAGAIGIIWFQGRDAVLNVVTYRLVQPPLAVAVTPWLAPITVVAGMIALAVGAALQDADLSASTRKSSYLTVVSAVVLIVTAIASIAGWRPGFWTLAAACMLTAVLVERSFIITAKAKKLSRRNGSQWCLGALIAAIIVATIWHTWMQREFWRHFTLGYADFGLYTRELEYCLFYNDIADRWANTRMAYHFEPLFYVLAPLYAILRSPLFLMVVGPLALNAAAAAFYWMVVRRTGSSIAGLFAGLTWLALPSISRMPYANTYGFESVYLAVPLLAFCFAAAHLNRWRTSHILLTLAVLCQETMVAVAVGWGVYIAVFCRKRRDGIVIIGASLVYVIICAGVVIPAISPAGEYVRSEMLGEGAAAQFVSRLIRQSYWAFLFALTAPLLPAMVRDPRMLLAAVPTLLMLGVIKNPEYLSVKFWHQSSVLPVLFTCACLGATRECASPSMKPTPVAQKRSNSVFGMLAGVLLLHQLMGYSPLAQSWSVQKTAGTFERSDPRMETVDWIRQDCPPHTTRAASTERMAAHLTDYRGLSTLECIDDNTDLKSFDVVIIDLTDDWDPVVRSGNIHRHIAAVQSAGFFELRRGGVLFFTRIKRNIIEPDTTP